MGPVYTSGALVARPEHRHWPHGPGARSLGFVGSCHNLVMKNQCAAAEPRCAWYDLQGTASKDWCRIKEHRHGLAQLVMRSRQHEMNSALAEAREGEVQWERFMSQATQDTERS